MFSLLRYVRSLVSDVSSEDTLTITLTMKYRIAASLSQYPSVLFFLFNPIIANTVSTFRDKCIPSRLYEFLKNLQRDKLKGKARFSTPVQYDALIEKKRTNRPWSEAQSTVRECRLLWSRLLHDLETASAIVVQFVAKEKHGKKRLMTRNYNEEQVVSRLLRIRTSLPVPR